MTMQDDIETTLRRAVEVTPSEGALLWLDQRLAIVMAQPTASGRSGLGNRRWIVRSLALLVALILLTTAVVAGMGLLDQIFEASGSPGWQTAWDRAERLGIKQTDAGITITLERAYADLNQVLVGITVEGLGDAPISAHGEPAHVEWEFGLSDPIGRGLDHGEWASSMTGTDLADASGSASVRFFEGAVTPVAGTWTLTITSVGYNSGGMVSGECFVGNTDPACANPPPNGMIEGTWTFAFELPAPAGIALAPGVRDTQGQATLTLTQLRITPTMIAHRIGLRIDGQTVTSWWPNDESLRLGGTAFEGNSGTHITQQLSAQGPAGDEFEFLTSAGTDEASGIWEIRIPEITFVGEDFTTEHVLTGPWLLTVTVP